MIPIREEDLKDRYRQENQLLEQPEVEEGDFVLQYHIRGIGYRKDARVNTKEGGDNKNPTIEQLLEDDRWEGAQVRYENGNEFLTEHLDAIKGDTGSRWEDINDIYEIGEFETEDGEEFTLYDIETKSIEGHSILDSSCHLDMRFEMNDHLMGITAMDPGRTGDPSKLTNDPGMNGQKIMTIGKAKQPKEWLTFAGKERGAEQELEPGDVGSTKYSKGLFIVWTFGTYEPGTIKPYYIEFFPNTPHMDGRWNARETSLPPLEPEEKLPKDERGENLRWLFWKPEDQVPYAVSDRAKKKEWVPEEGYDPVPDFWKEDNPDDYEEWKEWVKKTREEEGRKTEMASTVPFKLKYVWSKGPFVVRGTRNEQYYLMLKRDNGITEFKLDTNPLEDNSMSALKHEGTDTKWWDFTGEIDPGERYNPNKELLAHMEDLAEGQVEMKNTEDGYQLKISKGNMKGQWNLIESTDESDLYIFEKVSENQDEGNVKYALNKYTTEEKEYWDLSLQRENKPIASGYRKFILKEDPKVAKEGKWVKVVGVISCKDEKLFNINGPPEEVPRWMGKFTNGEMELENVDEGTATIYEDASRFKSLDIFGNELDGYYIFKKREDDWYFTKSSKVTGEMIAGDPDDHAYNPPLVESNDVIKVSPFADRFFTRALPETEYDRYDIPSKPESVEFQLMKYPVPNTVGKVAIQSVMFDKEKWTEDEAIEWVESNNISEWRSTYVKEE